MEEESFIWGGMMNEQPLVDDLLKEGDEIVAIIVSSIRTTNKNR